MKDRIVCPSCGFRQSSGESCARCGIVFARFKRLRPCPRCRHEQPPDVGVCQNCGHVIFGPPPDSPKSPISMASVIDRRGVEKARRNLFEWIYGYVVENVRAAAMVLGIVLVLTLIAGKIPVFSVLLEKEHEIMYAGQFDNCKRMKQFIRKDALLFRLKVANTGQNPADEVRVVIEDIPYPVDQAFCVIQNVSADRERLYDPEVYAICENDWKTECPRMKPKLQLMATCDELYAARQVLIAESEEAGESDERHAADYSMFYADPCPEEDGSPGRIRKRFRIERMAPGTLVFIGFTSFEDEGSDYDWKALENIRVTVEADCEVVAGDPQATALARIYKSILEFF